MRRIAIAALAIVLVAACSVSRRSYQLECGSTNDCDNGRTCLQGYCVFGLGGDGGDGCPSQCSSCNLQAMTCEIDGGSSATCPPGWSCAVDCSMPNSCNMVSCNGASSCTVTCSAANTCATVDCGDGSCNVTCSAANACKNVDCANSCQCDVSCGGGNQCGTLRCPKLGGGEYCTTDGNDGEACSSSYSSQCARC